MKTIARFFVCLTVAAAVQLVASVALGEDALPPLKSEADIDAAIRRLDSELTGFDALRQLLTTDIVTHTTGSAVNPLWHRIVDATGRVGDFKTISAAHSSEDVPVVIWAIGQIFTAKGALNDDRKPPSPLSADDDWESFVPRLRELASDGEWNERERAQALLTMYDGQSEFVDECIAKETNLHNINARVNGHRHPEDFAAHVERLLDHDDPKVRRHALLYIGSNSNSAEACRFDFSSDASSDVFRRVLELTRSTVETERSAAVFALKELRRPDAALLRERMLELADDPSADVRRQISSTLIDQLERQDVQNLLSRLLKDESPLVRYFTIATLGFDKHVAELEELAACKDKDIARWSTDQVRRLKRKE